MRKAVTILVALFVLFVLAVVVYSVGHHHGYSEAHIAAYNEGWVAAERSIDCPAQVKAARIDELLRNSGE